MKLTLSEPVVRHDTTIATVEVREPKAGELRGTKMSDVAQMDVNAMLIVLPRVTDPALLPAEIAALSMHDLFQLSAAVASFLGSRSDRDKLTAILAPE